jgi:competence protein ComFC
VEGRVALLVDDVMTTGSTAGEIARVLLDGGARGVNILTLARAMNEFSV